MVSKNNKCSNCDTIGYKMGFIGSPFKKLINKFYWIKKKILCIFIIFINGFCIIIFNNFSFNASIINC